MERDSAGVGIVQTPRGIARAPTGWVIDPDPYFRVGLADGETAYLFESIRGVVQLPDGSVLIVDGGSNELRVYDRDGGFLRSAGGTGNGPGEFVYARHVPTPGSDSILIFDKPLGRFTLYDTGVEIPEIPRVPEAAARETQEALGVGSGHMLSRLSRAFDPIPGSPPTLEPPEGLYNSPWIFKWISLETGAITAHVEFRGPTHYRGDGISVSIPYQSQVASGAVGKQGFFLTEGTLPQISHYGPDGRLERILRVDEPPRFATEEQFLDKLEEDLNWSIQVTRSSREPDFAQRLRRVYAEARGTYPQMRPVAVPSFDALRVDDEGWLWARVYDVERGDSWAATATTLNPSNQWMLFAPDGQARGTIELPPDLQVQQVGSDFILGVRRGDFGVEIVEGYRLRRVD